MMEVDTEQGVFRIQRRHSTLSKTFCNGDSLELVQKFYQCKCLSRLLTRCERWLRLSLLLEKPGPMIALIRLCTNVAGLRT
jgi:hypothetical protein